MKQLFLTLSISLFMISCGGEEATKDKTAVANTENDPIKIELADLVSDVNGGLEI